MRPGREALAALGMALFAPAACAQTESLRPPPGHTRSLSVPRIEASAAPVIDGNLDDAAWQDAPVAAGFWVSAYDRAPRETTEVRALADGAALYFAFTCHDSRPETIHAEQRQRDTGLARDDHVVVHLDPYHDHRQISNFSVNARGTQSDAMAGGRARKIEWKGDWQAAARQTQTGWTAEIRIPFAILNYHPGAGVFGVNFVRYHPRTDEFSQWADLTPQGLVEEMGRLTGLAPPAQAGPANRLTLMPYAAAGSNTPGRRGTLQRTLTATGLDARYDIASSLSGMLSLYPDFSQVEDDVLGVSFNYNERFRRDPRPFFQEGSAYFGGAGHFHSGRVPNFDVGLKSFGKAGPLQLGLLGTQSPGGRRDWVARAAREIGPTASVALLTVGSRRPEGFDNHLVSLQAGGRFRRRVVLNADLAATYTRGRAGGDGRRRSFSGQYATPYWQVGMGWDRTDARYFPANGFIADDVLGTQGGSVFLSYYRERAEGAFRSLSGSLSYGRRDTLTGLPQTRQFSLYVGGEARSDVQLNLGMTRGPYRPRGENPGTWSPTLNDDRFYTASAYFDTRSDRRGWGLTYSWGFLGGGRYSDLLPSFWLKPTPRTYLSYSYERAESFGVATQNVLSLAWEIGPEQSLSARWVGSGGSYGGGHSYRLAYRRQVRRGIDVFAVFNTDPYSPDRFTVKLVRTLSPRRGF